MSIHYCHKNWQFAVGAGVSIICAGWFILFTLALYFFPAPDFSALSKVTGQLKFPLHVNGGKPKGQPSAAVVLDERTALILNLCSLDLCPLSESLKTLKTGDHVTLWLQNDRLWQLAHGDKLLLPYKTVIDGERGQIQRSYLVWGAMSILSLLFLFWGLLKR